MGGRNQTDCKGKKRGKKKESEKKRESKKKREGKEKKGEGRKGITP